MEALSSITMTVANRLGTINMLVLDFLDHGLTLAADWYCGTLSLLQTFFASRPGYFTKLLSLCIKMPGVTHPTGLTAVYGCTSDRLWISPSLALSVLSFIASLRSNWPASDCSRCWCEAIITSWLQTLDNSVFTVKYKPWYCCGANAKIVVVTVLRCDVYRLLHVCHVLIKVTVTFWHESVCYRTFLKFFVYKLRSEQVSS